MTNSKGRMKAGVKCRLMATVAELGWGAREAMVESAAELWLQISPPPRLQMRMGLFCNIKVMLMKMKGQFSPICFLMIHHENQAPRGL